MSRRTGLVKKATPDWKNALIDLGGRNNLLHFRDLKLGTLDLTAADPHAVGGLLLGKATADPLLREQHVRPFCRGGMPNSGVSTAQNVSIQVALAALSHVALRD